MANAEHGQMVWVLSEESPFTDPEASGGCVCGVFASPEAALLSLVYDIGRDNFQAITWYRWHEHSYDGIGYANTIYILRAHPVQTETAMRVESQEFHAQHDAAGDPYRAFSTADLRARLEYAIEVEES